MILVCEEVVFKREAFQQRLRRTTNEEYIDTSSTRDQSKFRDNNIMVFKLCDSFVRYRYDTVDGRPRTGMDSYHGLRQN